MCSVAVGEAGNRLYICPICGSALRDEYNFLDEWTYIYNQDEWCDKCEREIVPLATPQEVEQKTMGYSTFTSVGELY